MFSHNLCIKPTWFNNIKVVLLPWFSTTKLFLTEEIMKKRFLALLSATALLLALLASCAAEPTASDPAPEDEGAPVAEESAAEETPAEEITLRVRTGWGENNLPNWPDAIATYEEQNPGIKVEMEYSQPDMTKLRAEFLAGNAPDIAQTWKTYFNEFAAEGLLVDITAEYEEHGWTGDTLVNGVRGWVSTLPEATNESASAFGVADYVNTSVIYYNKGVFEELGLTEPTNMQELVAVSDALVAAGIKPMVVPGGGTNIVDILAKIQVQYTGLDYLLDVNTGAAKFTDAPMVEAMDTLQYMIDEGVIDKSSLTYTEQDCERELSTGSAAMYSMHTAYDPVMQALQEEVEGFEYGIMEGIAFADDPVAQTSCTYGANWVIPTGSQNIEEAKDFLFYIFGEEVSNVSAAEAGRITTIVSSNANIQSPAILTVVEHQLPDLNIDTFYLIDMVPGSVLTAFVAGIQAMIDGSGDGMAALESAQNAMDQVLEDAA